MSHQQAQLQLSKKDEAMIYLPKKHQEAQFALTRILSESGRFNEAVQKILKSICECFDWELGEMWRRDFDADLLRLECMWYPPSLDASEFELLSRNTTFALGVGLPGRAWANGQPVTWIADVVKDSNFPRAPVAARMGLHGALAFPLVERNEKIGVMAFFSKEIKPFDKVSFAIIADIGTRIGSFLNEKKAEELFFSNERTYKTIFDYSTDFMCLFNADGRILYLNKGGRAMLGIDINEKITNMCISDCYPKWVHCTIINEIIPAVIDKNIQSGESVLSHRDGHEIPVLQTIIAHRDTYGNVEFLSLMARNIAEQIKMEKELKQGLDDMQKALYGTVEAISLMCEMRDPYTARHERRVAGLACAIAKKMGLNKNRIEGIQISAFLHDIGKIAAPAEILCKPSELSGFEYGIIKAHPEIGYRILKNIKFPSSMPVAHIVLQHHELLD